MSIIESMIVLMIGVCIIVVGYIKENARIRNVGCVIAVVSATLLLYLL